MNSFAGLELAVEKPQRMTLMHPVTGQPIRDGDGNEAWIDLYSADSKIARDHSNAIQRRRLAAARTRGATAVTPEQLDAEAVDLLAALTTGWRLLTLAGEPLDVPFSPQHARELYSSPALSWVRVQADEFAASRGNFAPASSPS